MGSKVGRGAWKLARARRAKYRSLLSMPNFLGIQRDRSDCVLDGLRQTRHFTKRVRTGKFTAFKSVMDETVSCPGTIASPNIETELEFLERSPRRWWRFAKCNAVRKQLRTTKDILLRALFIPGT